jgi:hypothetical protein
VYILGMNDRISDGMLSSRDDYRLDVPELSTLKVGAVNSIEKVLQLHTEFGSPGVRQSYFDGTIVTELDMSFSDESRAEDRVIFAKGESLTSIRLKRLPLLSEVAIRSTLYDQGILSENHFVSVRETIEDDDTRQHFFTHYSFNRFRSNAAIIDAEVIRSNSALSRKGKPADKISQLFKDQYQQYPEERMMSKFDLKDFQKHIRGISVARKAILRNSLERIEEEL